MDENNFKIGDKVKHKAENKFDMIIIDNGRVKSHERSKTLKLNDKHPDVFICRYYNMDSTKWEERRFYYYELEKVD